MDLDVDEVDLALIDLYALADDCGVCPFQFHRLLQERITTAYLIVSELDDRLADDPMPSVAVH